MRDIAPFGLDILKFGVSGFDDVRLGVGAPPLVIWIDDIGDAASGVNTVDLGGDDVANGLFGAADGAEIFYEFKVVGGGDLIGLFSRRTTTFVRVTVPM